MSDKINITKYQEQTHKIDISALEKYMSRDEIKKLSPDESFMPINCIIEFENTNKTIINSLRRVVLSQIPTYVLACEKKNGCSMDTSDPFPYVDMIEDRIGLIPIKQDIPTGAKFRLNVKNTTSDVIPIYSSSIEQTAGKIGKYFAGNFIICNLNSGTYMNIDSIAVEQNIAYNSNARYTVATGATSTQLDVLPLNVKYPVGDSRRGVSSANANPRKFRLEFQTSGSMAPKDILLAACETITKRILAVRELLPSISHEENLYTFIISDEDETIGELIQKCGLELFPKLPKLIYKISDHDKKMKIDIYTDMEINELLDKIIDRIYSIYTIIIKQLRALN